MRDLTATELAWVAGIIEGEGSFLLQTGGHRRRPVGVIVVMMTDEDVLLRLARYVGAGDVRAVNQTAHPERRALWCWRITRTNDVVALARQLRPLMGERRQGQLDRVLTAIDREDA